MRPTIFVNNVDMGNGLQDESQETSGLSPTLLGVISAAVVVGVGGGAYFIYVKSKVPNIPPRVLNPYIAPQGITPPAQTRPPTAPTRPMQPPPGLHPPHHNAMGSFPSPNFVPNI